MSSKKQFLFLVILLMYVNLINILFVIVRLSGFTSIRAIIVYDYFLIGILILLRVPSALIWLGFFIIFSFDLASQVSATFLFSVQEFVRNFKFSFLYNFPAAYYNNLLILAIFLLLNLSIIIKLNKPKKVFIGKMIGFFCMVTVFIYVLDFMNGNSIFNTAQNKFFSISKFNIGESLLRNVFDTIDGLTTQSVKPEQINHSITFKTFEEDSMNNQLLIIVESLGMPESQDDWKAFKNAMLKKATTAGWNIDIGSTSFKGSTTAAELRELTNSSGDYRYFLNKDSAKLLTSIFLIKKRQDYTTVAAHSFAARMFERSVWWKNIGIDSAIFMEDVIKKKKLSTNQLNYSTPFTSLNDEDTFSALNGMTHTNKKFFGYLLTENTHLPFYSNIYLKENNGFSDKGSLSNEANAQLKRIQELLLFFFTNINKDQWSKVLIVGDHMPPFSKETDRGFYSKKKVPFIILSK